MSRATVWTRMAGIADWRSVSVLRRNALVYLRNWRTAFLPPAMEPVVFFLAFGLGLGGYVGTLGDAARPIDYPTYVAPGLVAYTAFSTPFFEALYSSYVRMFYQKTWDGILATQVELHHIFWGEVLWSGVRGFMNTCVVCAVLGVFQLVGAVQLSPEMLLALPPLALVVGWAFGAFALVFTATVPSIDHMNFPVFLLGVPLGLLSNTYFPLVTEVPALRLVQWLNPVFHTAELFRALTVHGDVVGHAVGLAVTAGGLLVLSALVGQRLLHRRVFGE